MKQMATLLIVLVAILRTAVADYFGNGKNVTWNIQSTRVWETRVRNAQLVSFNHFYSNKGSQATRAADLTPIM